MTNVPAKQKAPRVIWQLGGGPTARSYADDLIKFGVALIGPGDAGQWTAEMDDEDFEGSFVRRFATEPEVGDVFLLRTGISKIRAVGLVASDYLFLNQFDDVNGWDLRHARRVRWSAAAEYDFGKLVFGANPPRFSGVAHQEVIDYTQRFLNSPPDAWQTAALPGLPPEEPELKEVPTNLQEIVGEVRDLWPLFWNRDRFGDHPTEDELVAHLVVPLLRRSGWQPEQIAVKWHHIDVAVFKALPRTPENCHLVIEAKRLGAGVEGALGQAIGYVKALGVDRDVVVTDGVRYRMYAADVDFAPVAYANLIRLKQSAPELFARLKRP
jgi:hypothetical protein